MYRAALIGGMWASGSGAGLFCLTYHQGMAHLPEHWPFAAAYCPGVDKKQEFPDYIPKKWIHLMKHAKKARTRKKWKNQIRRTIQLHERRQHRKGANA